jgi:hypothetical protein
MVFEILVFEIPYSTVFHIYICILKSSIYRPQFVLLHQLHASYMLGFLHATLHFLHATHASCTIRYASCTLHYASCTLRYAFRPLRYAFRPLRHASCTLRYASCTLRYVSCTLRYASYTLLTRLHACSTFWSQLEIAWKWLKPEKKMVKGIIMNIYDTE